MQTYVLLSRLTDEGAKTIKEKPERILEVNREIEALGAKVIHQYATLGRYDFVTIIEATGAMAVARVAVELGARGTVKIETLSALPVDDFVARLQQK
ncbi:GYD domain-containing protein [Candidatus Bipolaricaulota bacterium]|nr:GYD domain-containing protein [Candidatus Bipolaricaulota bacterium]